MGRRHRDERRGFDTTAGARVLVVLATVAAMAAGSDSQAGAGERLKFAGSLQKPRRGRARHAESRRAAELRRSGDALAAADDGVDRR